MDGYLVLGVKKRISELEGDVERMAAEVNLEKAMHSQLEREMEEIKKCERDGITEESFLFWSERSKKFKNEIKECQRRHKETQKNLKDYEKSLEQSISKKVPK
mmetsp:Transcript_11208/g.28277  ORF Transcript_11208/g.28277 Transcript_11208/m.28277 type:complete len:103 (-) Transcript_11208:156-464(-)|eukprot:CAMPEP_0177656222 /NCGR_PEP_ID=MMETSP0447-20121125/15430_1 /TAXON_ID=0 /ORGANISM="Stygamoeba regulata, Strain BSH-02190019" /LENGTH=102 /DNA_ID=CAMNT_0019160283 /DNA_START=79 /DNA_END=387 /DNA_ORIENTATION=-